MKGNDTQTYTSLRLTHAKSLQDISELKKLRETVGRNIREASLLVDGHGYDYTEHRENLKRTREKFSKFERRLSNATLSSLENVNIRCNCWDGSVHSYSSGDDNWSVTGRKRNSRPLSVAMQSGLSISDDHSGWKSRQRYSYCNNSDAQSLSSAHSCSPRSQRSRTFKQIVVPIYEDSFDSGVSVQTTSPRTEGSISTVAVSNGHHNRVYDQQSIKGYTRKGSTYDSDTSSAVSFPQSQTTTESNGRRRSSSNNNSNRRIALLQNWRSTPNLLEEELPNTARRRNKSLLDVNSCHSVSDSKRDLASKSSEWKSLPDLGSRPQKSKDGTRRTRKKKGLRHLFRRITKSGEYVLQSNEKDSKGKDKSKVKRVKQEPISIPHSASPLGKTTQVIEGNVVLHRVEIKLPRNGLYGFYVQKGFKKSKTGVFIGSFVTPQMKKLFAGVIREGDEIIEINSLKTDSIGFEKVLDILHDTKLLDLLILPYVYRKK